MLRGIYTGASGMSAMQVKMDTVANNLANVDKTAFKEDVAIFKANPEVLIHRTRDDVERLEARIERVARLRAGRPATP